MAERQSQTDPLPHSLAVARDLAVGGFGHADVLERLGGGAVGFGVVHAREAQPSADEGPPGGALRERVDLRAVPDPLAEDLRVVRAHAEYGDPATARSDEARYQVQERRLAEAVGSHQAGHTRRRRERHAVDARQASPERVWLLTLR
jgi:hypothetical protein